MAVSSNLLDKHSPERTFQVIMLLKALLVCYHIPCLYCKCCTSVMPHINSTSCLPTFVKFSCTCSHHQWSAECSILIDVNTIMMRQYFHLEWAISSFLDIDRLGLSKLPSLSGHTSASCIRVCCALGKSRSEPLQRQEQSATNRPSPGCRGLHLRQLN